MKDKFIMRVCGRGDAEGLSGIRVGVMGFVCIRRRKHGVKVDDLLCTRRHMNGDVVRDISIEDERGEGKDKFWSFGKLRASCITKMFFDRVERSRELRNI